jgi:hypothetical protein
LETTFVWSPFEVPVRDYAAAKQFVPEIHIVGFIPVPPADLENIVHGVVRDIAADVVQLLA